MTKVTGNRCACTKYGGRNNRWPGCMAELVHSKVRLKAPMKSKIGTEKSLIREGPIE